MTVMVEIPDSVVASVVPEGMDPARKLLEDTVAQAYREKRIGAGVLREVLGLSWQEKEDFLGRYGIDNGYTIEDFQSDMRTMDYIEKLRQTEALEK